MAEPWQKSFQDAATEIMFKIHFFHDSVMFYIILVLTIVIWFLFRVYANFSIFKTSITHKFILHGSLLETLWTIFPIVILLLIAFPSFKILYLTDQVLFPQLTLKILGRQRYRSYEISDYSSHEQDITFDSYMVANNDLKVGELRLMEVDNRLIIPIGTRVRLIVSSGDVIHCWTIPSLGVKIDAVPGRLNQSSFVLNREGLYYGACSEICGSDHGYMPINLQGVNLNYYVSWVHSQFN